MVCVAIHEHDCGMDAYLFFVEGKVIPGEEAIIKALGLNFDDGMDNLYTSQVHNVDEDSVINDQSIPPCIPTI